MHRLDLGNGNSIRILESSHAKDLFALVEKNREFLRIWLPWVDATKSVTDTQSYIEFTREQQKENASFHYGIFLGAEIVGCIALPEVDWNLGITKIGYWLGEDFQGRGIITSATKALIDHAIKDLGMNKVEIRCAVANRKSRGVPERLGFKLEGTLRQASKLPDGMVDLAVYGMLASEWTQRN